MRDWNAGSMVSMRLVVRKRMAVLCSRMRRSTCESIDRSIGVSEMKLSFECSFSAALGFKLNKT